MAKGERLDSVPLISLITINYNQAAVTCALLESTRRLNYPRFETIVVDNASVEDPTALIKQGNYPNVKVVVSPENLGFSGGNNLGLQHAKGDYFFFLNNDTEVTPDLLDQLLAPFLTNPKIGITCPKIRYYDHPTIIQYAGYHPLNRYTGRTWSIGLGETDQGQHDKSGITSFAHGAAMMASRRAVEQGGAMSEAYFLYYEELDWSMQIQRAGFQIYYQASALIYHKESLSVGKTNPLKVYYHTRNRLLFMRRNVGGFSLYFFILYYFSFALTKAVIVYTLKRQTAYLVALKNAVLWHFRNKIRRPEKEVFPSAVAAI
ncbi:glycosyltransferase family 2 protein [Larkinella rosea]|uniref:Glycosyltransferase family 2 protein n=1 Tax=Larkinella rosea TaxID=2025312 RepID=A0A3P1BJL1_9BACT|nr:glycosyltransferase family 2 protein [Larkinella rosea]RRB01248.1 glycosyltransferase family 2 protein [Larkinella rosea]